MTITKVISYFISLAMISVILWAQNQTSLFDSIIPTLPWGIVSLVDLYSGFILIAIWMIYREKKLYFCCLGLLFNDIRKSNYSCLRNLLYK